MENTLIKEKLQEVIDFGNKILRPREYLNLGGKILHPEEINAYNLKLEELKNLSYKMEVDSFNSHCINKIKTYTWEEIEKSDLFTNIDFFERIRINSFTPMAGGWTIFSKKQIAHRK